MNENNYNDICITENKYQIFISYRRDGGESLAALFYERLSRMGYSVFYDVERLRSGDFNEKLYTVIEECEDFLLVLPEKGLDRCINEEDWVRKEIVHALKHNKNIIPIFMRGFSWPENMPEAIIEIKTKNGINANMDFFDAVMQKLTSQFFKSQIDYPRDEEYVRGLKRLIKLENAEAINELGWIYERGLYSEPQDLKKALELYKRAYDKGNFFAGYNIADIYEKCADDLTLVKEYGISVDDKNPDDAKKRLKDMAIDLYERIANNDNAEALYKLGNIKEQDGDYEAAVRYYTRSASLGNYGPAYNALGWLYHKGLGGLEMDYDKAKEYYMKAIEEGIIAAKYNYATMIKDVDSEKAMELLQEVVFGDGTIPEATYILGLLYENKHDIRNAIMCYESALEMGISEAGLALERCKNNWY